MKFHLSPETELTVSIIQKILQQDRLDFNQLQKKEDYYLGKHQILSKTATDTSKPCNKIVNPYAKIITDTLAGYFLGHPVTYTSTDEDALNELNMIYAYSDSTTEDMELARTASIYGVAYELVYVDEDGQIRIARVNPKDIVIIYDDSIEENILYAIRKIPCYDIESDRHYFKLELYSAETIKYYEANSSLTGITFIDEQEHYFNDVPIVVYSNNEFQTGDAESVYSLIDAYDSLESDSLDDFDYFTDAYLVLSGMTANAEDIATMKENRVLLLDENSSASWLLKNSTDTTQENLKNRIKTDIHKFSACPDLSDESFSNNSSGVAIKYKLYGTETLTANKERYFIKGLLRRIELIFNILNLANKSYDFRSININFNRDLPQNETEIAQMVNQLQNIVSKETLLAQIPFVANVPAELEKVTEENQTNPFYSISAEELING